MEASLTAFSHACASMSDPAVASSAAEALQSLRSAPGALDLVRAALSHALPEAAHLQAVLLFRDVALVAWPTLDSQQRAGLREWALNTAAECKARLVQRNLLLVLALLYKRSWAEEGEAPKQALLSQLHSLLNHADPGHAQLGASLALALVTEFDSSADGRATSIGLPVELHRSAAASFQVTGLREVFTMAAQALLQQLQAANGGSSLEITRVDHALLVTLLSTLAGCITWDFTGRGGDAAAAAGTTGGASAGRLRPMRGSPGKAWRDVLADPSLSIVRALGAVYSAIRGTLLAHEEVGTITRGLLCSLCGLRPDVFASADGYAAHIRALAGLLLGWLEDPLLPRTAEMVSAANAAAAAAGAKRGYSDEDAFETALAEAGEAGEGLNALLWTGGVRRLACAIDAPSALGVITRFAMSMLKSVEDVAAQVHAAADAAACAAAATSAVSASASFLGGGGRAAQQHQNGNGAALLSRARAALESFAETRFAPTSTCVDTYLEVWASLLFALGEAERETAVALADARTVAAASAFSASATSFGGAAPRHQFSGGGGGANFNLSSYGSGGGGEVVELDAVDTAVMRLSSSAREGAGALFASALSSRLAYSSALVRVGIDDDNPFEDSSLYDTHMEALGVIGRWAAEATVPLLTTQLRAAHARLRALSAQRQASASSSAASPYAFASPQFSSGGGGGLDATSPAHAGSAAAQRVKLAQQQQHQSFFNVLQQPHAQQSTVPVSEEDMDAELGAANEVAWWLMAFAGYLLADEARGETPAMPISLNLLSARYVAEAESRAAGAGSSRHLNAAVRDAGRPLSYRATNDSVGGNDSASGEAPPIEPEVVAHDPLVQLIMEALGLCQSETACLLACSEGAIRRATGTDSSVVASAAGSSAPSSSSSVFQSPLLAHQCLWFLSRWARTYLLPDPDTYTAASSSSSSSSHPLSRSLAIAFGAPPVILMSQTQLQLAQAPPALAAYGAVSITTPQLQLAPSGLRPLPVTSVRGMPIGGGRAALEFVLQSALIALALWGGGGGAGGGGGIVGAESSVLREALRVLRALTNNERSCAWATLSPTWSLALEAFSRALGGAGLSRLGSSSSSSGAGENAALTASPSASLTAALPIYDPHLWMGALSLLGSSAPDAQGELLAVLISVTRSIGAIDDPEARKTLLDICSGGGGGTGGLQPDAIAEVARTAGAGVSSLLGRWQAYYFTYLLQPLQGRVGACFGRPELLAAAAAAGGKGASSGLGAAAAAAAAAVGLTPAAIAREVDVLLCLLTGVVHATSRLPDCWHMPLSIPSVEGAAAIIDAVRGVGPLCLRALRFVLEMMDADTAECSAAQSDRLYAALTGVFRAFTRHHVVAAVSARSRPPPQQQQQEKANGGGGAWRPVGAHASSSPSSTASSSSAAAAHAAQAEEDDEVVYEDVLSLLNILEKLVEKEDISFTSSSTAPSGGPSEAAVEGLRLVIPLVTPALLGYPKLTSAFVGVVSELMCGHPAQVCSLDGETLGALFGVLDTGARSLDGDVVVEALAAVKSLGSYHGAVLHSSGSTQAKSPPLSPAVFGRLVGLVLGVVVGPLPPARLAIPAAGEALLALAAADPGAFRTTVGGMLSAQPAHTAQRLAADFNALTTTTTTTTASGAAAGVDGSGGGGGGGVDLIRESGAKGSAGRAARVKFGAQFERFVESVRGYTSFR